MNTYKKLCAECLDFLYNSLGQFASGTGTAHRVRGGNGTYVWKGSIVTGLGKVETFKITLARKENVWSGSS